MEEEKVKGYMRRTRVPSIMKTILASFLSAIVVTPGAAEVPDLETVLGQIEKHGAEIYSMEALLEQKKWTEILEEFEQRYDGIEFYYLRIKTEMDMLQKAMEKAGSTEPLAVARALASALCQTANAAGCRTSALRKAGVQREQEQGENQAQDPLQGGPILRVRGTSRP